VHGVPAPGRIDTDVLETLVAAHRRRRASLTTTLQNPTGATQHGRAFRLLQVAERHRMWVIEDDVTATRAAGRAAVAALEGSSVLTWAVSEDVSRGALAMSSPTRVLPQLARTRRWRWTQSSGSSGLVDR